MSPKEVESVLMHAMRDAAFADQLFSNAEKALAGYDLTAEEIANLKSISRAEFEGKFAMATPEERKSFALTGNHNESALVVR